MKNLRELLKATPYQGYVYCYPHKTSYRKLAKPKILSEIWSKQNRASLTLYVHIPFCEMRCGFCNLFTIANPQAQLKNPYLDALARHAHVSAQSLGNNFSFSRLALGGGTPTFLSYDGLNQLFTILVEHFGYEARSIPACCETSPKTIDKEKIQLLLQWGINRISIGIQSFNLTETKTLGRTQAPEVAHQALDLLRNSKLPILNVDLIYGINGQTRKTWQHTLDQALIYQPEEIYLYPLYIRPLTGASKMDKPINDLQLNLYRFGRDYLLARGYQQLSMRMFQKESVVRNLSTATDNINYCCQLDGTVGLGVGARSLTSDLHFCSDYAVNRRLIKKIIYDYIHMSPDSLKLVDYGFPLNLEEQKRRHIIKSLLHCEGLEYDVYQQRFDNHPTGDFPELNQLLDCKLASENNNTLLLNARGLERADTIGPWLYSQDVKRAMQEYQLK